MRRKGSVNGTQCYEEIDLPTFSDDPNMRGENLSKTRRSAGREVQIKPTHISIVDHQTMSHWSRVGLVDFA